MWRVRLVRSPLDLNNLGHVVGYSATGSYTEHAFLYTGGATRDLGALPGYPFSYGLGLNSDGQVVGFASADEDRFAGENRRAFDYRDGRMPDLNDAIAPGSPWVLLEARAVNDAGAIAGIGKLNNEVRAFLLTPM